MSRIGLVMLVWVKWLGSVGGNDCEFGSSAGAAVSGGCAVSYSTGMALAGGPMLPARSFCCTVYWYRPSTRLPGSVSLTWPLASGVTLTSDVARVGLPLGRPVAGLMTSR